jgi:hypothetical protein
MVADNSRVGSDVVVSIETAVTFDGKPLLKVLKYVKLSQLHPQLACTPNKQYQQKMHLH